MGIREFFGLRRASKPDAPASDGAGGDSTANRMPGMGPHGRGLVANPENAVRYLYRQMWVDGDHLSRVRDIRRMDRDDGRVKMIHRRTARAAAKGGLTLRVYDGPAWLSREWSAFEQRLHLARREKLESDLRGLMMEGNLALQWVLDEHGRVAAAVRMPSETIKPLVGANGQFIDPRRAYEQYDLAGLASAQVVATFPLWQLSLGRLDPDNYDDWGSLGRPYLDASRAAWRKLTMTEDDLVIRRRMRAPLRMAHTLEGASAEDLATYRAQVEADQADGAYKDYYLNKKGAVTPVQGDAELDQIADVAYLLDTFFAGAPAPKGLFGLGAAELQRDILEDLKKDFFDELDAMQDNAAGVYETGFRLQLLLAGRNPDAYRFEVQFAERRTDTPNQRADLGLKYQALGASRETVLEAAGLNPADEQARLEKQRKAGDPYPMPGMETPPMPGERRPAPKVSVTPGNAPKGESATSITSSPQA